MHPKQEELERKMSLLCQALDNHLEDIYGEHYRVHPNRLKRGKAANPSFDGLFSTSLAFTLGYGSKFGRGYVVNVEVRTLDKVSGGRHQGRGFRVHQPEPEEVPAGQ